jgi:hypothetical protein
MLDPICMKRVAMMGMLAVLVGCGGAEKSAVSPSAAPVEPKAAEAPAAEAPAAAATPATPIPAAPAAPGAGAASAASAPSSKPGAAPKVSLTVAGTPFKPTMAYVVGPVTSRRATVLVTEEEPHTSCERAAKAMEAKPHLKMRVFYTPTGGIKIDKPVPAPANGAGTAPFIELTPGKGAVSDLAGSLSMKAGPETKGELAHMTVAFQKDATSIKGELDALVCVTKADFD